METKIFDTYSRNLDDILKLIPNLKRSGERLYMCPLCRKLFSEESLDPMIANPLTIEHIPPESVGGKEVVLTCKKCNNDHGSKFDSHLIEKLNFKKIALLKPGTKRKNVKYTIDNEIFSNGNLFVDDSGKLNFVLEESRTNPIFHNEIIDIVTGKRGDAKVEFSTLTYNENRAKIAILRAAYLKSFKELGYAFIFNLNSDIPRRQITTGHLATEPVKGVYMTSRNSCMIGLSIINKPSSLQGYVVGMRIENDGIEEYYNVFLPGGNIQGINMYSELQRIKSSKDEESESSFEITLLDGDDYLLGENKYFALEYWGNNFIVQKGPPSM